MATDLKPISDDDLDPSTDQYLRAARVVNAINAALPQGSTALTPIPHDYVFKKRDRETVSVALHAAFELIGGVPALVQWGATNPDKFFSLWSKLLPSETETPAGGVTINFQSAVPSNPLDLVSLDENGKVIELRDDQELPE